MSVVTIAQLVKQVREYYEAALVEGFNAREAFDLAVSYQTSKIFAETARRPRDPWEKP